MKAEIPFLPASGSVTANTIITWPFLPEVMNCLAPWWWRSPSRCARVRSVGGVRSRLRLLLEAADPLAARHLWQEPVLLLIGAEFDDGHAADRTVDAQDGGAGPRHRRRSPPAPMRRSRPPCRTAMFFRHQHTEETQFPHLLEFGSREGVRLIAGGRSSAPIVPGRNHGPYREFGSACL